MNERTKVEWSNGIPLEKEPPERPPKRWATELISIFDGTMKINKQDNALVGGKTKKKRCSFKL